MKRGKEKNKKPAGDKPNHQQRNDDENGTRKAAWREDSKSVWRKFPGPSGVDVPLRISMDRKAFKKVTGHVLETIEEEICGVFVGETCSDEEGIYVHVKDTIRGTSARKGASHVTFTQETWNSIHHQLEIEFSGMTIVGWYHSHPGFGVRFSEMDIFIQKNFFVSGSQFAFVMDPLGGERAICIMNAQGVQYIDRFWVEGKEMKSAIFSNEPRTGIQTPLPAVDSDISQKMESMETRLRQVLYSLETQKAAMNRVLLVMAFVFLLSLMGGIFYFIFQNHSLINEPPRLTQYIPVPVQVGEEQVYIGVGVVDWRFPSRDLRDDPTQSENKKKKKSGKKSPSKIGDYRKSVEKR